MAARHALACVCGSCRAWEIIGPEPTFLGFLGTAWAHPKGHIRCMTCGREFAVSITVDPSEHLMEVPIDVDAVGMPIDGIPAGSLPIGGMPITIDDDVPSAPGVLDVVEETPVVPAAPDDFQGGASGGAGGGAGFDAPDPSPADPIDPAVSGD